MGAADAAQLFERIVDVPDANPLTLIVGPAPLFVLLVPLLGIHGGILCTLRLLGLSGPLASCAPRARVGAQ